LEKAPGYRPPDDPEIESVRRGYRIVDPIDVPFKNGAESLEALVEAILDGVAADDRKILYGRQITFEEFEEILWPEFPQSRPVTNLTAHNAWFFLHHHTVGGINKLLLDHGGADLVFRGVSFTEGVTHYTNFSAYQGMLIHCETAQGRQVVLDHASTAVERDGVWKIYVFKD
jgi:hypothetical protein